MTNEELENLTSKISTVSIIKPGDVVLLTTDHYPSQREIDTMRIQLDKMEETLSFKVKFILLPNMHIEGIMRKNDTTQ